MKITNPEPAGGYQCIWSNLNEHPKCPHGPTLLFGRYIDGDYKKFYACSACRDRKLCPFYLDHGEKPTKQQKQTWELEKKKVLPHYDHQKMFIRFNEMLAENPCRRMYCHNCARLSFISEIHKHRDHEVIENLTDHQMSHPTEILKPLDNPKKEAQYLFSEQSTKNIVNMLLMLGARNVLCIGAPRIHEYITNNLEDKVSSLLLDFDGRFHNFFGPLNFCWYNFFNHHFFNEESKNVFKDFLTQNGGKDTFVICDPPFGGRVEPMSQTLKTISDLHKKWNDIKTEGDELKTMFVFPYYMEPALREKANPIGVPGGLKELKMSDYKVDYDNHPLFAKSQDRKIGSQVRIFTNVDLNLLKLPESEGYKYCKRCKKWTSAENKHCKKCKECTSKDGRRYRHCNICTRCVKPTWKHCKKCNRCALEAHKCGEAPKITGQCYKCYEFGHVEKSCTKSAEDISNPNSIGNGKLSKGKKRENEDKNDVVSKKKSRIINTIEMPKITKKKNNEKAKLVSIQTEKPRVVKAKKIKSEESTKSSLKLKSKKLITKSTIGSSKKEKVAIETADDSTEMKQNDITKLKKKSISKIKNSNEIKTSVMTAKKSLALKIGSVPSKKQKKVSSAINVRKNVKFTDGKVSKKRLSKQM